MVSSVSSSRSLAVHGETSKEIITGAADSAESACLLSMELYRMRASYELTCIVSSVTVCTAVRMMTRFGCLART